MVLLKGIFQFLFNEKEKSSLWITRFFLLRGLGFIYAIGFLVLINQFRPLFGEQGLLPASVFLERLLLHFGSVFSGFWNLPSLFWVSSSDLVMMIFVISGLILSILVMFGLTNAIAQFLLWMTYMSFVHVGQVFYGFGWESILLEFGFVKDVKVSSILPSLLIKIL